MEITEKKKILLKELLNLYIQYEYVSKDAVGSRTLMAIIKGKEDLLFNILADERMANLEKTNQ